MWDIFCVVYFISHPFFHSLKPQNLTAPHHPSFIPFASCIFKNSTLASDTLKAIIPRSYMLPPTSSINHSLMIINQQQLIQAARNITCTLGDEWNLSGIRMLKRKSRKKKQVIRYVVRTCPLLTQQKAMQDRGKVSACVRCARRKEIQAYTCVTRACAMTALKCLVQKGKWAHTGACRCESASARLTVTVFNAPHFFVG